MARDLPTELTNTLEAIEKHIDHLYTEALDCGYLVYDLQNADGSYIFTPLLLTKANILIVLAQLQTLPKGGQR